MDTGLRVKSLLCGSLIIALLSACSKNNVSSNEVVNQFAKAINQGDAAAMIELSEVPFVVDNQEWQSASDGSGFVLGQRTQIVFTKEEKLSSYISSLSNELKIESVEGGYIAITEYSRFQDEFGDFASDWESLDAFFFLRGMGDVEHIVILGVNRESKKVVRLYFN